MKFAFNTFAFSSFPTLLPTYSIEETIRSIASIGYDAIEIGCCAPHAWPQHLSKDRRQEIAALACDEGISVSSVLPAIGGGFGCNPCSHLRAERQATIAHYFEIIDLAYDLSARKVLFIAGWRAEGMSMADGWQFSLECLRKIAAYASDRQIEIVIEPTPADTNLVDTAADARRMMEQSECSNVSLMLDTCHVDYEGCKLSRYVEDMGDNLSHLHAADTGRSAIGAGKMDWDDLLSALVRARYQGYFTVETGFGNRNIDPREVAKSSLAFLKGRLGQLRAA